ncbi:hypothetical protein ACKGJN_15350 [Gillisia sp. Q332]|uniref:hypothetical protein n=1 Tax=Gillisia xinjiangensis TaxID=3384765 RepID=UPI00391B064E
MKKILTLLALLIFIVSCKNDPEKAETTQNESAFEEPITKEIAYANGFKNFKDVNQINFTFNVKVNDTLRSERSWKWFPKKNKVELTEKGETSGYSTVGDLNEEETKIDQKFINDKYWLLFPYELIWSEYEFAHNRNSVAPLSQKKMHQITVKYSDTSGYTPGDTYLIYFDENDKMIREWTYQSAGGRSLSTTWEDYETFNGITIAKMHKSEDGSFQLFFTDIMVK